MSSRSLNKVTLIGNLTRDPELRYTPAGTAVCTFGVATNRSWTTQTGETKEETEFHRIVAWNKLGELCSQLLAKGRKVYVEGRLTTRSWTGQDGVQRTSTEVVIEDMIILDSKRVIPAETAETTTLSPQISTSTATAATTLVPSPSDDSKKASKKPSKKEAVKSQEKVEKAVTEDITPEDIPF